MSNLKNKIINLYYLLISNRSPFQALLILFGFKKKNHTLLKLNHERQIVIRNSTNDIHELIAVYSGKEYPIKLFKNFSDQSIVFDIGAHIGAFTLYFKNHFPHAKIYCFEPDRENFSLLNKNIDLNQLINVFSIPYAIYSKNCQVTLSADNHEANSWQLSEDSSGHTQAVTLESSMKTWKIAAVDLLKLDCEGSEYAILLNNRSLAKVQRVIFEYHTHPKYNFHDLKTSLTKQGFKLIWHRPTPHLEFGKGVAYFSKTD